MSKKIAIIGAGACGLMLAVQLEKYNIDYTLFNMGKVGRKILASGNGKCNISNAKFDEKAYHYNPLACKIVSDNKDALFSLLKELKIYTKVDNEGRMYPISESSQSVLNILLKNINKEIISLECNKISKKNGKYYINDSYGEYDYVVIATGSNAAFKKPYPTLSYLDSLHVEYNTFTPSLVGFKTNKKIKPISGVRNKALVGLYKNDKLIHQEHGEVMFKDDGISGICVMNLSSYYANLNNKNNTYVKIDLSYNADYDDLESVLAPKLYKYVLENNIDIHNFIINITGTYDMEFAQVAHGGIKLSEVNNNLSLKKHPNIFVGGEIVDFDALCGGYNLMLAFTSSIQILRSIKNEISNK